jgi:hypothetical protein
MTLNLTIVNTWGVWQCSDHRLVDPADWKVVDNYSIKHVILRCPDGAALLAYAGVGRVGSVDVSDWIRETLRGETRTLDQSLILIRENSTLDLAPLLHTHGVHHMFSIGAFLAGRPWVIQIRNFATPTGVPSGAVLDHFETVGKEITDSGQGFVFGDPQAISPRDQDKLMTLATRRPRRPKDFRNLLASINRRAAVTPSGKRTVSPGCVTSYLPPAGEPVECEFHDGAAAPAPLVVPMLWFGIDGTEMERRVMRQTATLRGSPESADASFQQESEHAGKQSVTPRNRLRR